MRRALVLAASSLVLFYDDLSYSLLLPGLPQFEHRLGIGAMEVGWVLSIGLVVTLCCAPVLGWVIHRRGDPLPIVGLGLLLFGAATAMYGLPYSLGFLVVARILQGLAVAASFPAVLAMVARSAPAASATRDLSLVNAVATLGALVAPAGAGLAIQAIGFPGAYLMVAGLVICSSPPILLLLSQTPAIDRRDRTAPEPPDRQDMPLHPGAALVGAAVVMFQLGSLQVLAPLYSSERFHAGPFVIGGYLTLVGIAFALAQPIVAGMTGGRWGRHLPTLGYFGAASALLIAAASTGTALLGATMAAAPFLGFVFVSATASTSAAPAAAAAFGRFEAAIAFGLMLGTAAAGVVLEHWGEAAVLLVCASTLLCAAAGERVVASVAPQRVRT